MLCRLGMGHIAQYWGRGRRGKSPETHVQWSVTMSQGHICELPAAFETFEISVYKTYLFSGAGRVGGWAAMSECDFGHHCCFLRSWCSGGCSLDRATGYVFFSSTCWVVFSSCQPQERNAST